MSHATFDRRLGAIVARHARLAHGTAFRLERDGLITAHPRATARRLPLGGLLLALLATLTLKALLLASWGPDLDPHLMALEAGNAVERAAAVLLRPDPATRLLADALPLP